MIFPYFRGKTLFDYNLERVDDELKEKAFPSISSCPDIPNSAESSMSGDVGHQMVNYEKVLHKGLKGIRAEVEYYLAQVDQPYDHYSLQEKKRFLQIRSDFN